VFGVFCDAILGTRVVLNQCHDINILRNKFFYFTANIKILPDIYLDINIHPIAAIREKTNKTEILYKTTCNDIVN